MGELSVSKPEGEMTTNHIVKKKQMLHTQCTPVAKNQFLPKIAAKIHFDFSLLTYGLIASVVEISKF